MISVILCQTNARMLHACYKTIYSQNTTAYWFVYSLKKYLIVGTSAYMCCCWWFNEFTSLLCLAGCIVCSSLRQNELAARVNLSLGLDRSLIYISDYRHLKFYIVNFILYVLINVSGTALC